MKNLLLLKKLKTFTMKSKFYLSTLIILLFVTTNFAQASFTSTGIAVQGIARDNNNTAIQNQTINLNFKFYYKDATIGDIQIGSVISKQLTTDNFGVFSTIVDPNYQNNSQFSNYDVWLTITYANITISNEPLNHVPYAISANNGVPTGSIMPYMGKIAPPGWQMCNGSVVTTGSPLAIFLQAQGLPSNKTPNLQGMFLRGVGTSTNSSVTTILGDTQDDAFASHSHLSGTLKADSNGNHTHSYNSGHNSTAGIARGSYYTDEIGYQDTLNTTTQNGAHTHNVSGTTAVSGSIETRPVNFGVNYIIKL